MSAVPGVVENLLCTGGSSVSEFNLTWNMPTVLGHEVIGYRVEVKGLHHRDGTREVVQFNVSGFITDANEATIDNDLCNVVFIILPMY